jgi:hypothetical protein
MQALIALKNFITAGLYHAKPPPATQTIVESLVSCLLDELLTSFSYSDNNLQHVRIYQRALQQLAVALPAEKTSHKKQLQVTATAIVYIKEQLPQYFNWDEQAIPATTALHRFTALVNQLNTSSAPPLLVGIISYLHHAISVSNCSWRQLAAIEDLLYASHNNALPALNPLVFATNFNLADHVIIQSFIQHFKQHIGQAEAPAAEIRRLLKQLNQDAVHVPHFSNGTASLKQQLNDWLSEELFFIEATSPVPPPPGILPAQVPKISTSLSVAQFAAFLRLLMEANIITCSNQRQFLSFIAANLKTTNANHISPQSFRNKYYGPETNTLTVVKDICISMINHARKMSGN